MYKNKYITIGLTTFVTILLVLSVAWLAVRLTQGSFGSQQKNTSLVTSGGGVNSDAKEGLSLAGESLEESDLNINSVSSSFDGIESSERSSFGPIKVDLDVLDREGASYSHFDDMGEFYIATANGSNYEPLQLLLHVENLQLEECKIVHQYLLDDEPSDTRKVNLDMSAKQPLKAYDGDHAITATCTKDEEEYSNTLKFRIADNQPEKCRDFTFEEKPLSARTTEAIKSGIVGTWKGCVSTPWTPAYYATIEFKQDGTYSAVSDEVLDGMEANAMYYGTEKDSPLKKYRIDNVNSSGVGSGEIDIYFHESDAVTTSPLKNIKLMNNKLYFEFMHRGSYGPLKYELNKS